MEINKQLDDLLEKWNLLKHPFYKAWTEGSLPVEALRLYASEYGSYISLLADGWVTLGDDHTAVEEREHVLLWDEFCASLDTKINEPELKETVYLHDLAKSLFATPVTALGAMYAFEAQQPLTARSKLKGLTTHYSLPEEASLYFEVHADNFEESQRLLRSLDRLDENEKLEARQACEQMCIALWSALSGIHDKACLVN
jgi:pyrroloquinoline-quinone synthase